MDSSPGTVVRRRRKPLLYSGPRLRCIKCNNTRWPDNPKKYCETCTDESPKLRKNYGYPSQKKCFKCNRARLEGSKYCDRCTDDSPRLKAKRCVKCYRQRDPNNPKNYCFICTDATPKLVRKKHARKRCSKCRMERRMRGRAKICRQCRALEKLPKVYLCASCKVPVAKHTVYCMPCWDEIKEPIPPDCLRCKGPKYERKHLASRFCLECDAMISRVLKRWAETDYDTPVRDLAVEHDVPETTLYQRITRMRQKGLLCPRESTKKTQYHHASG